MSAELRKGQKAIITGLVNRQDLNGEVVTLLRWAKKHGRWEVECERVREKVRIRPVNLAPVACRGIDSRGGSGIGVIGDRERPVVVRDRETLKPLIGDVLKQMVRGDSFGAMDGIQDLRICGQI